ncbi:MAG: helix-turn-helix transcriptional regulator [Candidatus Electrothrix sp. Rat3]|nr:helix-turn-helix transcriptional regulator [Candidatus Electrothrix rattekaaiensis]
MTKQKTSDSQDTRETLEEHTPHQDHKESENLPIGKLLRQVREKKALTIHDISQETNISSSNLTSIEQGNYNGLPADTFIRGQIIIYAQFLDIDGKEAARLFFEERSQHLTRKESNPFNQKEKGLSTKQLAEPAHISSATWAVSLLLLIITFLIVFSWYTDWNPFAYYSEQESTQVSATTTAAHRTKPEPRPDADMLPNSNTLEEAVTPSVTVPIPATAQEKLEATDSDTVKQDTASE